MAIDKSLIRDFPPITASLASDNTGVLRVGTVETRVAEDSERQVRRALMGLIRAEAAKSGRPVRVTTTDDAGLSVLLVSPDGEIEEESATVYETPTAPEPVAPAEPALLETVPARPIIENVPPAAPAPVTAEPVTAVPVQTVVVEPVQVEVTPHFTQRPEPTPVTRTVETAVQAPAAEAPATRRSMRSAPSFLAAPTVVEPAKHGFAGLLNTIGMHMAPSEAELAERADVHEVSRHFTARRTISVINRKGGANKTPTVVNLAAVFARYGGGGVLAWDNNETMGTLGWRTEPGGHESTVLDVIESAEDLLGSRAEFGQMAKFVHHQPADKFDVLRSDENIDGTHEVTADEVDLIHRVAAKYYRLIFMDSGNSDRAENWLRMIELTDQLVIPTTTMEDRAQAAMLTLQALEGRNENAAELASNAVVVVSEWQARENDIARRIADDFRPYVRDVVIVPFDPALKSGRIQHSALQPATQRAWLAAAAAVARGL